MGQNILVSGFIIQSFLVTETMHTCAYGLLLMFRIFYSAFTEPFGRCCSSICLQKEIFNIKIYYFVSSGMSVFTCAFTV